MLGIDRSYLYKLMKGQHRPTCRTIKLIAQGLQRLDSKDWREHAAMIKGGQNENL